MTSCNAVADPDLQVRGEAGGRSKKLFFPPFGPQFGPKIREGLKSIFLENVSVQHTAVIQLLTPWNTAEWRYLADGTSLGNWLTSITDHVLEVILKLRISSKSPREVEYPANTSKYPGPCTMECPNRATWLTVTLGCDKSASTFLQRPAPTVRVWLQSGPVKPLVQTQWPSVCELKLNTLLITIMK